MKNVPDHCYLREKYLWIYKFVELYDQMYRYNVNYSKPYQPMERIEEGFIYRYRDKNKYSVCENITSRWFVFELNDDKDSYKLIDYTYIEFVCFGDLYKPTKKDIENSFLNYKLLSKL